MNRKFVAVALLLAGIVFYMVGMWPLSVVLMVAGALVLAKGRSTPKESLLPTPAPSQPKSSYSIDHDTQDQLIVSVIPATRNRAVALPVLLGCVVALVVGFVMMLVTYTTNNVAYLLWSPALGLLVGYLGIKKLNHDPRPCVRDGRFYVSESNINYRTDQGQLTTINVDQIDRIRACQTYAGSATQVISYASDAASLLGNAFEHHGYKIRQKREDWLSDNSFVLQVEEGGRAHVMAGGMDETTSYSLMKAVCQKTGFGN